MLTEFFLEKAHIELTDDGSRYFGSVPGLPEIHVEASTPEECLNKLAIAIDRSLSTEVEIPDVAFPASLSMELEATTPGIFASSARPGESYPTTTRAARQKPAVEFRSSPAHYTEIVYEKRDWVATVTINRPDVYNAYSSTTLREMARAFRDAARDDRIAVIVLTGAGNRAFCTGSDVKEHTEEHIGRPDEFSRWMQLLIDAHESFRNIGKPTIARINGIVAAGGNEWGIACDFAIAAEHAKFTQIETSVGMVAATGSAQWLPLIIGDRRAREMLLTGEPITAKKAHDWGLVNQVVPLSELDDAVDVLCQKLINRFPECTKYTRHQLNYWKDLVWNATIDKAREWLALHFSGSEASEGMNALVEQREVDYRGFRLSASLSRSAGGNSDLNLREPHGPNVERSCGACGAQGLPGSHDYCGRCGAALRPAAQDGGEFK
jgi:enoyl-CoA hydratase/carnithine racemase/predicted RNase H-like HicB family nuclease